MAMNGDDMGDAIRVAVSAAAETDPSDRDALFKAIGNAVVGHIQNNAEVTIDDPSGLVDNQGGPPATSHTGSATGGIN